MLMEPQISLDCEACIHPGSTWINDSYCGVTASSQKCDGQPIATGTKKQTRQWAAWTRQEEEIFFNALRQFGKNFEKITCRVQSKNKDQVRHYYYRLVRRMNKLLGHGLCLDAKNSKDTNAAMLRWWSLLEKYSCKSSKLHLKPRRFKIFIETLEHQLLKDRKKSKRKPSSQGENYLPVTPTIISNHGRACPPVNLVLVDSENIQQLDSGKGPSVKRNVNVGINRRNCKSDSFPAKVARQRRKPGNASSAAYKRWEKAAIAGVSLVADAAEHLERTTIDKEVDHVQGHKGFDPAGKGKPPLPPPSPNSVVENNSQSSVKLKLQLFPIDEGTRKSLEMDNRNPHLELTLSTRKKISSVVEHLNRKWGNSNVASGELMLFPYYAQSENLGGYQRWTQDSVLSAADVYALIGSPSVFRLRYGWFSDAELLSPTFQAPVVSSGMVCNLNMNVDDAKEHSKDVLQVPTPSSDCQSGKLVGQRDKDQQVSGAEYTDVASSSTEVTNEIITCIGVDANNNLPESSVFWNRRNAGNGAIFREGDSKDNMQLRNGHSLSAGEWADSLTNVSVGDLLSEVSHNVDNGVDPLEMGSSQCPQQGPFSCDSFDAAIAAHIHRHQNKACLPPALSPFGSSIWDAEETCDAFSFQKLVPRDKIQGSSCIASSGVFKKIGGISLADSGASIKESLEVDVPTNDEPFEEPMDEETEDDNSAYGEPVDKCQSDTSVLENSPKNISGLTDMFWPDSLGPLDLDIPTCKYHTEDLILSDSLSGFNRLLGSSLDAFQNCSFFGFDKKETISTAEAKEPTSFSEYKIGSGVSDFAKA